jgi:hypothetical protein
LAVLQPFFAKRIDDLSEIQTNCLYLAVKGISFASETG